MIGWVKIHRNLIEWEWFQHSETTHLFLYLLLKANHTAGKWQGHTVKRGQLITGRLNLAQATGMTESMAQRCLNRLKLNGEIVVKSNNKFSLITICKYDFYQSKSDGSNQQYNSKRTANRQQMTTNNKDKNKKNENKYKKEVILFYNDILFFFPEKMRPKNDSQKNNWLSVIERLTDKEKYSFTDVRRIIEYFRKDDFWSGNFLSLPKLMKKNKDGLRYIDVFNEKLKTKKADCKINTDSMEQIINNKERLNF